MAEVKTINAMYANGHYRILRLLCFYFVAFNNTGYLSNELSGNAAGTPDEVVNIGALLMGQDGAFITGSDILMDGGVTADYWYGIFKNKITY